MSFPSYPSSQIWYKILNLLTNKTIVARDVPWHDHIFPFKMLVIVSTSIHSLLLFLGSMFSKMTAYRYRWLYWIIWQCSWWH